MRKLLAMGGFFIIMDKIIQQFAMDKN